MNISVQFGGDKVAIGYKIEKMPTPTLVNYGEDEELLDDYVKKYVTKSPEEIFEEAYCEMLWGEAKENNN